MTELKPCPCGKVPKKLKFDNPQNPAIFEIYGDCCVWEMSVFRANESMTEEQAAEAWNSAPRAEQ